MATSTTGIPVPLRDISCQQLLAKNDVTLHGVLRQRRMLNEWVEGLLQTAHLKWSQVYAVLYSGCLYLFKNELSPRSRFATSLYGFTQISQCDPSEVAAGVSWPFKLVSEIEVRNRIFFFSSPSQANTEKWIEGLTLQMALANRVSPEFYSGSNVSAGQFSSHPVTAAHTAVPVPLPPIPEQKQQQPPPVLAPRTRPQPSNTAVVSPTTKQQETAISPVPQPRPRLPPPNCPDLQIETAESDEDDYEDEEGNYDTVEDLDVKRAAMRHKTVLGGLQSMGGQLKRGFTNIVRKNDKNKTDNKCSAPSISSASSSPAAAAATTPVTKDSSAQPHSRPPLAAPAADKHDSNEHQFRALPPMPKQTGKAKSFSPAPAALAKPTRTVRPTPAPKPSSPRSPNGGDNVSTSSDTYNRSIESTSSYEQSAGTSENEHYDDIKAPRDIEEDVEELRRAAFWNKSTSEAEDVMRNVEHEGAFMLRESAGETGKLTLMVRIDSIVRKFKIHTDPQSGELFLEMKSPRFKTDAHLLAYYRKNPLPHRTTMLTQPYSAVTSS